MQIDPTILSTLDSIEWLKACGKESSLSREKYFRQVSSWSEADAAYDETWESIIEQQKNAITNILFTHYKEKYNQWNELLKVVSDEVSQRISLPLKETIEEIGLNPFYADAIFLDIRLYVIEITYAQDGCKIPIFFRNLFTTYQAGHFPCGWGGGTFPSGYLLYY